MRAADSSAALAWPSIARMASAAMGNVSLAKVFQIPDTAEAMAMEVALCPKEDSTV